MRLHHIPAKLISNRQRDEGGLQRGEIPPCSGLGPSKQERTKLDHDLCADCQPVWETERSGGGGHRPYRLWEIPRQRCR